MSTQTLPYSPFDTEHDSDARDIVGEVERYIRRFCILPAHAYLPLATWTLATKLATSFDCFPYLALLSPAKRCGKTRLLEVLEILCARAWRGTAPSPASLYRMMADCPTLLLDEVEALKNTKGASETQQAILAVLNAGHRRGATVPRCDGKDHELRFFPVYGPKAFAAIGNLPDTLADRSIIVTMQRRTAEQRIERFLYARAKSDAAPLCDAMNKWAAKHISDVRFAYENHGDLPWLGDRDADLWMPLFAVYSIAAPERIGELKRCALALSGSKQAEDADDSIALRLLTDLRTVWPEDAAHASTAHLLEGLKGLDESPWAEYETTPRKLTKWLRPFDVKPRTVRIGETTPRGYQRVDFEEAWKRYLPAEGDLSATTTQPA